MRHTALLLLLGSTLSACAAAPDEVVATTQDALCSTACPSGALRGDALLTPVNRTNGLRSDWSPGAQTLPAAYANGTQSLRPDARAQFIAMVDAAKRANVYLVCLSGYRSFATQCSLFASYAASNGCEGANTFSANAGHSEHQLGTVCDIALASSGSTFIVPGSAADAWLRTHAQEFGFANSYPNDDASLNDGYIHEPWHYRFIGVAAASALKQKEATLGDGRRLAVPVFIAGLDSDERARLDTSNAPSTSPPTAPATPSCASLPFAGRCTGTVLEWCQSNVYHRVDCATKTDGRVRCGEDPRPEIGNNCVR